LGSSLFIATSTKEILNSFSFPVTVTVFQLLFKIQYCIFIIYIKQRGTPFQLYRIFTNLWENTDTRILYLSLAATRLFAKLTYAWSLVYVKAAFMDIISITGPIFTVIILYFLKNQKTPLKTIATTIPIMLGVGLSTVNETQMNLFGLLGALISTALFCLANILTKFLLTDRKLQDLELALISDITSLGMMVPLWLGSDIFSSLNPQWFSFMILWMLLLNGLASFIQTICAFFLLDHFSSLTYALLNISKRVVVIVGSLIYFGTEFSYLAIFGTGLALFGIFLYSYIGK